MTLKNRKKKLIEKSFKNNKFKISTLTWNEEYELPDGSYSVPDMKNILKQLAKSFLIPLGLTAASATDAAIHKKMFGSGNKILIISIE